jgi:hypothetical protein
MKTIRWQVSENSRNPFSDPRLKHLDRLVVQSPPGWPGNQVFVNKHLDLPPRPQNYYREFYVGTSPESGSLRVVLGWNGEVYVTGNHYRDFIRVLHLPFSRGFSRSPYIKGGKPRKP